MRRPTRRIGKLRGEDVSRSLKLLCLKRNIENLSIIQENNGLSPWGNERFVGDSEVKHQLTRTGHFAQQAAMAIHWARFASPDKAKIG